MARRTRKASRAGKSPAAPLPAPAASNLTWLKVLLIVAAGFFIYGPTLHGDWLWDDDLLISDNALMRNPWGLLKIWSIPSPLFDFQPVTVSVEWIEWQLFGNNPSCFRVVNLLLHLVDALLVWRLLAKLGLRLAWVGGLLFVVHPVLAESVAWVSEMKNTLSAIPFLCAMMAWIDYDANRRPRDYWLALGLFVVAMLCKTTMVMFPFVIFLHAWWKHGRVAFGDLKAAAPFFAVSLVMGLLTIVFLHNNAMQHSPHLGGPLARLACASLVLSFYFATCVLPIGLSPIYPLWQVDPPQLVQFVPLLIIAGVFAALLVSRKPWSRHVVFGLAFFFVNLLPFAGLTAGSYMGFSWAMDHILYLPIIGLIALFVAACGHIGSLLGPAKRWMGVTALVVVMIALTAKCRVYSDIFFTQERLWRCALREQPDLWIAHLDLGNALYGKGEADAAIAEFRESIRLHPDNAVGHYNIGSVLMSQSRFEESIGELQQAAALNPKYVKAHASLGTSLMKLGKTDEAIKEYRAALDLAPDAALVRSNLGAALLAKQDFPGAEKELKEALAADPGNAEAYYNLGNVYFMTKRLPEARDEYLKSIALNPGNAPTHNNLGALYKSTGDIPSAIQEFQAALKADPASESARANLQQLGVTPAP